MTECEEGNLFFFETVIQRNESPPATTPKDPAGVRTGVSERKAPTI